MSAELITASMLNVTGITNIVGNRRALGQLPQNTTMPALVYDVVSNVPKPNVAYQNGLQMAVARIQINPLALSIGQVKTIHEAVRLALDFKHQVIVAGKLVISCRFESAEGFEKDIGETDSDLGIWTQSADYILTYYE